MRDFALTHKHLCLWFGFVAAVAMLFPGVHAAGEELYHPVLLQQTLRVFFGHEPQSSALIQLLPPAAWPPLNTFCWSSLLPSPIPEFLLVAEPASPVLGKCQRVALSVCPWIILLFLEKFSASHPLCDTGQYIHYRPVPFICLSSLRLLPVPPDFRSQQQPGVYLSPCPLKRNCLNKLTSLAVSFRLCFL